MPKKKYTKKQIKYIKYYYWKKKNKNKKFYILKKFLSVLFNFFKKKFFCKIKKIQKETSAKIFITLKGEKVKSGVEKKIADFLYQQKIDYTYENPKVISNGKTIYPDFYLNKYNVYIEYFGMLGDKKYNSIMAIKESTFQKENMDVIKLYPNNYKNLGYIIKKRFEKVTNKTFPQRAFIPYYK